MAPKEKALWCSDLAASQDHATVDRAPRMACSEPRGLCVLPITWGWQPQTKREESARNPAETL